MLKLGEILGYAPIDIHSHFNHGVPGDDNNPAIDEIHHKDIPFLLSEYDNVGIEFGVFSTFSSVLRSDRIVEENEYLYDISQSNESIYQWVVVHPKQEETFEQARKMIGRGKVLGIKLQPYQHQYMINDYADKIFSFANELGTVVLMHPDSVEDMAGFCDNYPNMKLIIAHLGSSEHIRAVERSKIGNIYLDTSGGASYLNNVIEEACSRIGADKILFGTDTYSCAFQAGRIAFARISDEDKRKILRDNAVRIFSQAFGG
ncbi:MAG: amidohydrolase [Ruminococcaceae bacterium]|nr:amidohydrolase [Oscillospiraceae bacterium]